VLRRATPPTHPFWFSISFFVFPVLSRSAIRPPRLSVPPPPQLLSQSTATSPVPAPRALLASDLVPSPTLMPPPPPIPHPRRHLRTHAPSTACVGPFYRHRLYHLRSGDVHVAPRHRPPPPPGRVRG
jgi:hypothetical protein